MAKSYDTTGTYMRKADAQRIKSVRLCLYCGSDYNLVIDHILPMAKGGKSNIENLTRACNKCNSRKTDFTIEQFLERNKSKREVVYKKAMRFISRLRNEKSRHNYKNIEQFSVLISQLRTSREQHIYYTRVINSITYKKYLIINNG